MAVLVLSSARKNDHNSANVVTREKDEKLGGAIVAGILAGAVAAFLVGGMLSSTDSTTSVLQVGHSVSSHP